jgi:hypothetical protein
VAKAAVAAAGKAGEGVARAAVALPASGRAAVGWAATAVGTEAEAAAEAVVEGRAAWARRGPGHLGWWRVAAEVLGAAAHLRWPD